MFRHLIIYRISNDWLPDAAQLEQALDAERFQPCGPTMAHAAGWTPPRGEPGARLLEEINGHWLLTLQTEKRLLPNSVITDRAEELADLQEQETGRRPGKRQMRDLKEQATVELLPRAFTQQQRLRVWIAPTQRLLMVDAGSIGKADELITLLVKADSKLNLHLVQSAESPTACMAFWLMSGTPPQHFTVDRNTELRAADEMKSAVRYQRHNLDLDEVKAHLASGKMPTRLEMTWKDRVSFTLTDAMTVKSIKFLDIVFDGRSKPAADEAFDVDATLATGELIAMLPDLIAGLGGELDFIGQSAKIAAAHASAAAPAPAADAPPSHCSGDGPDPLYDAAVAVVLEHKRASISLVQRHLRVGYNRAARLLEEMQRSGLVTPMSADGSRELKAVAA